ncbi:electron transfer flavoprotein subunit alpha/FixB family protein [Halobacteriales archaeon Cl-PHB]
MTVLVVAEHRRGDLRPVTYEAISAAGVLAEELGTELHVAAVGGPVEDFGERLDREGVDAVHLVDADEEYNNELTVQGAAQVAEAVDATHVVAPHSVNGMDTAPALAERLALPLVTDAVDLSATDGLVVTREFYGGKAEGTVNVEGDGAVVTVRPGEWPEAGGTGDATVEAFDADLAVDAARTNVTGFQEVGAGDVDITEADVLVSVGRGIEEEENLDIIEDLADALDATISASRPIVDNEWLPKDRQVGQSGKVVTPDVYLAIGISGAVQHVAGMKGAETIIAINNDPNAPIYDIADYGIVDDLFDVVPALTEEFGG